ncbi:protein-glutamate methylesterase/protein-glutamine glutaminase [Neobacillus citreus]|uniref:Protein-glutamate methylesterase/protein-glutamine glutaminase n=1 Tax=Neobacillus citreus TaxID=2833578 RepID=A0A942SV09_9BACI|nr:chemotaxis response regulator protein-glutamate methylesterase [Neobacillus citreus]MCH6263934.1 chemotaxis response regulator protein-glutamate methylesterase [Neobacillus citreus]
MKKYGVLVVDDSAFMRRAISQLIEGDSQFFVVGIARNGLEAIEKVNRLRPDLVTMDVEMPEMNGIAALEQIMNTSPVPIVMLSSRTGEGAAETIQALELGAVDFFLKESLIRSRVEQEHIQEFHMRLKSIVEAKRRPPVAVKQTQLKAVRVVRQRQTELIFIGCSTGGPSALQAILPRFSANFPIPVVVAQHMPAGFTKPLAERFNSLCQLPVQEAKDGQVIKAGNIYIAPSGYQTLFEKKPDGSVVFKIFDKVEGKTLYKPSIDISLNSAAPIFTNRLLSVILTGMGADGTKGCSLVKKYLGHVFVEAEDSCVVYGMPKSVLEAGYADGQFLLSQIYQEIISYVGY